MKNIKKAFSLIVSLVLLTSLVACSSGSGSADASKVAKVTIATGGTSGTYYGFSGVIAQSLNEILKDKIKFNYVSTGASKANIQMVDLGEADLAIVQNDVMSYAYNATDMFTGSEPINTFSAIASCYPECVQIITNKSINSIEELRGKKVSVGDAGSGVEFNAKQILEAYDMDIESDIIKNNQSFADSCNSLKNGTLDAAFVTAGHPTVAVTELASNYNFNILSIDDSHADKLISKYGFYTKLTIEKSAYKVLTAPVNTVAVMATFVANNNLSSDVVYEFTKGLFENKDTFNHQKAELLDPKTGISGISIPFHEGALKYYKELGLK